MKHVLTCRIFDYEREFVSPTALFEKLAESVKYDMCGCGPHSGARDKKLHRTRECGGLSSNVRIVGTCPYSKWTRRECVYQWLTVAPAIAASNIRVSLIPRQRAAAAVVLMNDR
ncbi:hypothetical protein CBL_01111 [Carabus blaptoides fortunei]